MHNLKESYKSKLKFGFYLEILNMNYRHLKMPLKVCLPPLLYFPLNDMPAYTGCHNFSHKLPQICPSLFPPINIMICVEIFYLFY